jgi:hypothetical protein
MGRTQPPVLLVMGLFPWGYMGQGVKLTTQENMDLYIHTPKRLYGILLYLGGGGGFSGTESTTEATTGLLYQPLMLDDDECGAVGGMSGSENRSTPRKPAPVSICPPHDLTRARTRAAAMGSLRLTA